MVKRTNKRLVSVVGLLLLALVIAACGGGGARVGGGNGSGGSGNGNGGTPPVVEHQDTGSITATMDDNNRTWHTVEGTFENGVNFNTAQWYIHEETGHYRVRLQGRKTKNFYDTAQTIEIILALEHSQADGLRLAPAIVDGPPEVEYFPVGPTFNPLNHFYFSNGELDVDEAEMTGDKTMSVKGTFSGTFTNGKDTITLVGGEFDIRKATQQPLEPLGWVDDEYGKVPNPLLACIEVDPCEIETLEQLQAIAEYRENLRHNYKLIADIDAGETWTWRHDDDNAGFVPIGSSDNPFTGKFDGNRKTISNLYIDRSGHPDGWETESGLFGAISDSAEVFNLTLEDANVKGVQRVGALVGFSRGSVSENTVSGKIMGVDPNLSVIGGVVGANEGTITRSHSDVIVEGEYKAGGLVGTNSGTVENSTSKGEVTGLIVGGLVGENGVERRASIFGSSSSAAVTANDGELGSVVGGLVGRNHGSLNYENKISDSFSTGTVKGLYQTGGLVGVNDRYGIIEGSYSTSDVDSEGQQDASHGTGGLVGVNDGEIRRGRSGGDVTGTVGSVGGLVGFNNQTGSITHSSSTSDVKGGPGERSELHSTGGLVGGNGGTVIVSYSHDNKVQGGGYVGGLVGRAFLSSVIQDSYSISEVEGLGNSGAMVGGLIGYLQVGRLQTSYSAGKVGDVGMQTGGLIGADTGGVGITTESSYWDKEASGQNNSKGGAGVTGLTTDEMKTESSYGVEWDFDSIWQMHATDGYPDLVDNPRGL